MVLTRRTSRLTQCENGTLGQLLYAERDSTMPQFPATRIYPINVDGFSDIWLKDESTQPTGTHKDRMAWEIVCIYRDILLAKKEGRWNGSLPQFSIISAGSAALALQSQFRKYNLPNLKILVDNDTDEQVLGFLEKLGCNVYKYNLGEKCLSSPDILRMTENLKGFDITSNHGFDPGEEFYDWLAYEIINHNPKYVLIPYGTGQLYENILNRNKREISIARRKLVAELPDPVFKGDPQLLSQCHFIGATTNDSHSKAVKLYAPFRPFVSVSKPDAIKLYAARGFCGQHSGVYEIHEDYLQEARKIADKNKVEAEWSALAGLALLIQLNDDKKTKRIIKPDANIIVVNTGKTKYIDH